MKKLVFWLRFSGHPKTKTREGGYTVVQGTIYEEVPYAGSDFRVVDGQFVEDLEGVKASLLEACEYLRPFVSYNSKRRIKIDEALNKERELREKWGLK